MSNKKIEMIKKMYPAGTQLCCDRMQDDPRPIEPGTLGSVIGVDDIGSVMVRWDNGRSLSLVPGVDSFHVVEQTQDEVMTEEPEMSM